MTWITLAWYGGLGLALMGLHFFGVEVCVGEEVWQKKMCHGGAWDWMCQSPLGRLVLDMGVPGVIVGVAGWVDWRTYRIPNKAVLALLLWRLILPDWSVAVKNLALMAGLLSLVAGVWRLWRGGRYGVLTRSALGWGDIKLCLACACYLSSPWLGVFLGAAGALALVMAVVIQTVQRREGFVAQDGRLILPFGPALALAFWGCLGARLWFE